MLLKCQTVLSLCLLQEGQAATDDEKHIPKDSADAATNGAIPKQPTSPPESTFKKLAPSKNRYTILRDEL